MIYKLGHVFKIHREVHGVKLRNLAKKHSFSPSKLSGFENNKTEIPREQLRNLYSSLGIQAQFPINAYEYTEDLVKQLYYHISFVNDVKHKVYEELRKQKEYIQCTNAYIPWLLGEFLYFVYHPNTEFDYDNSMKYLNQYQEYLSPELKQMYYDTFGVYLKDTMCWDGALEAFNRGIQLAVSDTVIAMIYYHKTKILKNLGNLTEALICITHSKKLFDKFLNFKRAIMCSVELGSIHSKLEHYEDAERIYLQCLEAMKLVPVGEIMILYNNLAWNCLISNQYEKTLKYAKQGSRISTVFAGSIHFYQAYSYWKLGNMTLAKEYIKKAKVYKHGENEYMSATIDSFASFLSNQLSVEKKEKKLFKTFEIAKKSKDLQVQIFILELICELDFPKEYGDKKSSYLMMINELLKMRQ